MPESVDLLIVVPLREEFLVMETVFQVRRRPVAMCPASLPALFDVSVGPELTAVAVVLDEMSNTNSSMITERLLSRFRARLVIGLGIGGSLTRDLSPGDVAISRNVTEVFFESKAQDGPAGTVVLHPGGSGTFGAADYFLQYFRNFATTRIMESWTSSAKLDRATRALPDGRPARVSVALIASGPTVSASTVYTSQLKQFARDFKVLEMEGAGIARACTRRGNEPAVDFLLIRGISDNADDRKAELEEESRGEWRAHAVYNAAKLLQQCLGDPDFAQLFRSGARRGRPTVRLAVALNATVHYVDKIEFGLMTELRECLPDHLFHVVRVVGKPDGASAEDNEAALRALVTKFGDRHPDFVVTIGTAVSVAAVRALPRSYPVTFLGVSDPDPAILFPADRTNQGSVVGVRYGLPIAETVEVLRTLLPGRRLVFVHSGDRFPQDNQLLAELAALRDGAHVEFRDVASPCVLPEAEESVFFGRFFFCSNIGAFSSFNPRAVLVGVSVDNLAVGAALCVGYDPEAIGRIGARELLASELRGAPRQPHGTVLQPGERIVAAHRTRLRTSGVSLAIPGTITVRWLDD